MLQTGKTQRLIFLVALAVVCCNPAFSETSVKPYSPFDDPKPRIPREIMEDKRLDVRVNVFVKSKNFRDLFAEISKQTGVKLTADRDIAAERAIIYFHARPLRDVMTELSGLFGYYWLPKGGSYELREDSRHAQRRKQVDKLRAGELQALFVSFTDKVMKNPAVLDQLLEDYPGPEGGPPMTSYYKGVPDLLSCLGMERMQDWASASESDFLPCEDLSPGLNEGVLEWVNTFSEYRRELAIKAGRDPSSIGKYGIMDLQQFELQYVPFPGSSMSMPRFMLSLRSVDGSGRKAWTFWPPSLAGEDDFRKAMGEPQREMAILENPLPDKCQITVNKPRVGEDDYQDSYVTLGDVLEAIAKTANVDVIADYHLQDCSLHLVRDSGQLLNDARCLSPFEKLELRKTLDLVKDKLSYAYDFDGSTLKLRYWPWFTMHPAPEPPPALIEKCWHELESNGALSLETLVEIANLPDVQLEWRGFGFVPCASRAFGSSDSLRIWRILGPKMVSTAETDAGLPVGRLDQEQLDKLMDWAGAYEEGFQPADMAQGVIHISHGSDDEGESFWQLSVNLQSQAIDGDRILVSSLSKDRLREMIAQRKADAEADRVEVVEE